MIKLYFVFILLLKICYSTSKNKTPAKTEISGKIQNVEHKKTDNKKSRVDLSQECNILMHKTKNKSIFIVIYSCVNKCHLQMK